jgi:VanZ family protein
MPGGFHHSDVVSNHLFVPFGVLGFGCGPRTPGSGRIAVVTASAGLALFVGVRSDGDGVISSAMWPTRRAWARAGLAVRNLGRGAASRRRPGRRRRTSPVAIASAVLAIAVWQPFGDLEVGTVVPKIRSLQADALQFTGLRDEGTSLMIAFLFASTLASYLSALGERHAGRKAAMLGIGLMTMLEASQILIGSRMPGLWDLAVSSVGIAAGAAVWTAAGRIIWPKLWFGVLVVATLTAAALQMLSPFQLTGTYHGFGMFPFFGYYAHTTFDTLSHVIELALLYFPLGFWIGRTPAGRRSSFRAAALVTLAIAIPVEYLQGWIEGRYADVTDVAISLAGAWLGVAAGRERTMDAARGDREPDSRDPRPAGGAQLQSGRHGAPRH